MMAEASVMSTVKIDLEEGLAALLPKTNQTIQEAARVGKAGLLRFSASCARWRSDSTLSPANAVALPIKTATDNSSPHHSMRIAVSSL